MNDVYYKEFESKSKKQYRILFYPNSLTRTGNVLVEFENVIINNDIVIKSEFEDDLPRGFELAKTIEIEIDVSNTAREIKDKLLRGSTFPETRNVDFIFQDYNFAVPNLWKIQRWSGTAWVDIFIGTQTMTPAIKLKASGGYIGFTINIIEITKFLLENISVKMLGDWMAYAATSITASKVYECDFMPMSGTRVKIYDEQIIDGKANTIYLYKLSELILGIQTMTQEMYNRLFVKSDIFTVDNPYKYVNFYDKIQDDNTLNSLGDLMTANDLLFIGHVTQEGMPDYVSGLFTEDDNSFVKEHQTVWDLIKKMAENNLVKYTFDAATKTFKCNALLSHNKPIVTIDKIQTSREITIGEKTVARAITHIQDTREGDISECEVKVTGVLNDASEETALVFNTLSQYDSDMGFKASRGGFTTTYNCINNRLGMRRLFCNDSGKIRKVHEIADIFIDNDKSINQFTNTPNKYEPFDGSKKSTLQAQYLNWIRGTVPNSYAYRVATLYSRLLGSPFTATVELTTTNDNVDTSDLGRAYNIDPSQYIGGDFLDNTLNSNCIVVSIEENISLDESKVKFFVRNDVWE